MPRHGSEDIRENKSDFYEEFYERRGLTKITHYRSPVLPPITAQVVKQFITEKYVWKTGDRYYTIANKFYGDSRLWWAIAWFNQKPTEGHINQGDLLYIPKPIGKLLTYLNTGEI